MFDDWEKIFNVEETFSSYVFDRIDFDDFMDFSRKYSISKNVFYRMRNFIDYQPSKNTVFKFCIGLKLSIEEATHLLSLAGYCFSPTSKADYIIKFCLKNSIYNIDDVNRLFYMELKTVLL